MKAYNHSIFSWIGSAFWIILTGLRLQGAWQRVHMIPVLLAIQAGLVAWRLVVRHAQTAGTSWIHRIVAWLSALIPLALVIHHQTLLGQALASLGLLLVLWALSALGCAFGIAPADRGIVRRGPYRIIRHPMYLGELISLVGVVIGDPSLHNLILIHVLLVTWLLRIHWEEQVLSSYASYTRQVRWRMLPGIW